jgi:hypothetical protein
MSNNMHKRCIQQYSGAPASVTAPTATTAVWEGVVTLKMLTATPVIANFKTDLTISSSCPVSAYPASAVLLKAAFVGVAAVFFALF